MSKNSRFERVAFVLTFGGLGCFLFSFVAMGLAPWTTLNNTVAVAASQANPYYEKDGALTSIGRGRRIYIREACWHCHSQFVRPVAGEPFRYGPTSQAWESMYDVPHTYGTRRVGPDLSREAGRRSDDWQLAHLYNPRSTVPQSIMPSYRWFFDESGGTPKPKQEALDLVAYLQQLGHTYKNEVQAIVYPKLFKVSGAPIETEERLERGSTLFRENCTGCHGSSGDGDGLAKEFLRPKAANLVKRFISTTEAYSILSRGVLGSAMPSFKEMPEQDLWALAQYVSSLGKETQAKRLPARYTQDKWDEMTRRGQQLFASTCAACHGSGGTGDGAAAAALNPRPKDFTRRVFAPEYFHELVKGGVPGSAMPAFSQLTDTQIQELSMYVDQLYQESL